MWNCNVLVSLLLFYITKVNCENEYPPAIAFYPKKTLMASDSNMTEWKPLNFKVDLTSLKHHNILEYCKKSFPDLEITNYFQSKDQVTIKNWCTQGKNVNCKGHQHKVFPYFCIDKNFEGLQIEPQKGCSMHVKGKKSKDKGKEKCYDQKDWYSVGLAACKETNSKLSDHAVMKPCKKPGYFEAFKFVCCPNARQKVIEKSEHVDDENADKCTLPPVVGMCRASIHRWHFDAKEKRCKVFLYGGCGGNKNNFATEEECENQCKCHLEKETGNCRGLFYKWHYNKATESCQEFVYGGCGGNMNRFESEQLCMSNCSVQATNKEDTTNVETEDFEVIISETEKDYSVPVDITFDQPHMSKNYLEELEDVNVNYKKARLAETENFEKLYKHGIVDNDSHMRLVTNLHGIERSYLSKYENLLNRFRTETFDTFLDKSSSASDLTNEEILESLMAYVATEKYEQQYYLEHNKILLDDFNKHANIATAKDTNVVISSLQENMSGLQNRLRKNLQSVDGRIKEEFSREIENILNDFQPIQLEVVTYQISDNIESSADSFDDTEYEEEEVYDQSQEFDVPNTFGSRTYEDDTEGEVTALKSTSWWLFWGGLLCVTLLIAVLATKMVFQGKKEKKIKEKKVTKKTQVFTPEEKQLLQMQQDGFENPTYKFFEKHQKA